MDKFDAMQMFVRVVEKGSFSAVAKERGIGQPAVSKQISALEDELGTELIHRTSRSIALTEPGRDFYESAVHILDDFENATSRIGRGHKSLECENVVAGHFRKNIVAVGIDPCRAT